MKQSLQLLAILLLAVNQQLSAQCRKDTLKTFTVDVNNVKTLQSRVIYSYNSNDRVVSELYQPYINQVWTNNKKTLFTYNSNLQLLTKIVQYWNTDLSQWDNHSKDENSYTNGNVSDAIEWLWSTSINNWYENKRNTYTYNNVNKVLSHIYKNQTVNVNQIVYEYDNNGNTTLEEFLKWQNSNWQKNNKTEKTYDANGNLTSVAPFFWDFSTSNYSNGQKTTYSYNASNQITLETNLSWDPQSNAYVETTKIYFSYNANGLYEKIVQNYYGPQVGWKPASRELKNYNQLKLLAETIIETYNPQTQTYEGNYKTEFGYNTNNVKNIQTNLNWNGTAYVPQNRETWEYNSLNKLTKNTNWSFAQQAGFVPYQEKVYEYLENDLLVAYENRTNFQSNVWQTRNREEYSCTRTTVSINHLVSENSINLYPNPAIKILNIENLNQNDQIRIVNQYGQLVMQIKSSSANTTIDLSEFNNGIYFVLIHSENGNLVLNQKFIKQ